MLDFTYCNPVNMVFGRDAIGGLTDHLPADATLLVAYGGGSIKNNGVYDQVMAALQGEGGRRVVEFGGIEPNPRYETLMEAVDLVKREGVDFLLAVGGGSVVDGVKFIAAAARYAGDDPWEICAKGAAVTDALPLGCVLTLPATGSEMNGGSVVSREATREKLFFVSPLVYPKFSILDPRTTFSLPPRLVANGIVDAFVHVLEQYLTRPAAAPLQDRQAEAILLTLVEEGPKTLADPEDYDARANLCWCAAQALNGLIGCGVPQDWATHMIGHELTALYGLDHARSLAVVLPGVMAFKEERKRDKLVQYAERIWGITSGTTKERTGAAREKTVAFFNSLGVETSLAALGIDPVEAGEEIAKRFAARQVRFGEDADIDGEAARRILQL